MTTLTRAAENGQLLKAKCGICSVTHFYRPGDIAQIYGEVTILDIEGRFRYSRRCSSKDWSNLSFVIPSAADRVKMTVRHLVEIKSVKVPVWKDVRG